MIAYFERFEIRMTKAQALSGSHPGPCDDDIEYLLRVPAIRRQLDKIPPEDIRQELKWHGAWDEVELSDEQANKERILWIACGVIREDLHERI